MTPSDLQQVQHLFGVPLYAWRCSNDESQTLGSALSFLKRLEIEDADNGRDYRSNLSNTGWHSSAFRPSSAPPAVNGLFDLVLSEFHRFMLKLLRLSHCANPDGVDRASMKVDCTGWFTSNAAADVTLAHVHSTPYRDTFACVLYLEIPPDMSGGEIRFSNPDLAYRCGPGSLLAQVGGETMYKKLAPESGLGVIFPGTLPHEVLPFDCASPDGRRRAFAANLAIEHIEYELIADGVKRTVKLY